MTDDERERIDQLRRSLGASGLGQLRQAEAAGLELLAFKGLAGWLEAAGRILLGGKECGFHERVLRFAERFATDYAPYVEPTLRQGLRNSLLHQHGTEGVVLTNGHVGLHLSETEEGCVVLDLATMLGDFEEAFEAFIGALETDADLRALVLPVVPSLVSGLEMHVVPAKSEERPGPDTRQLDPGYTASVTASPTGMAQHVKLIKPADPLSGLDGHPWRA